MTAVHLLHEWVTRAAEADPDGRALVRTDEVLTYEDLERTSNRLARALREVGCRRGDRVAFLLPRTPMALAVIVGILKADCIYVPLEVRSPAARLAKVIARCEPTVILAGPPTRARFEELAGEGALDQPVRLGWMDIEPESAGTIRSEAPSVDASPSREFEAAFTWSDVEALPSSSPQSAGHPDDAAYILFTSGSTGTPKGVVVTHRNVTTFIEWAVSYFGLSREDRIGGYTELTFDLSTFDIYATFASGAELHMVPEELKLLPPKIVAFMRKAKLTHWLSVPSFFEYATRFDAVRPDDLPDLRWMTWCGDVLPNASLRYWMDRLPHTRFANLYGPTETTVASSYYRVPEVPDESAAPVPIGKACAGEELLLLDDGLRPVPLGSVGHLHIRGAGLSPGYWREPERTREVFLPDPFDEKSQGSRIYRTGDLGRMDGEGNVHFLGREDQQVKTRGFRVELGELEGALRSLPEVEGCAVVGFARDGVPGKLLGCAFVPANGQAASPRALKEDLARILPDYMIPVRWKAVDQLPLTSRGKVDRRKIEDWMKETA